MKLNIKNVFNKNNTLPTPTVLIVNIFGMIINWSLFVLIHPVLDKLNYKTDLELKNR